MQGFWGWGWVGGEIGAYSKYKVLASVSRSTMEELIARQIKDKEAEEVSAGNL